MTAADKLANALTKGHTIEIALVGERVVITDRTAVDIFGATLSTDRMAKLMDSVQTALRHEEAGPFS